MGLLDGKNALIFGVANDHSIAWGIAQALHDEGAEVGLLVDREPHREARPAARGLDRLDLRRALRRPVRRATSRGVFARWRRDHDRLDILVHALAFAKREDLAGGFVDTSRDGFALALDVSAYSLVALTRAARPLLRPGSSVLTLTYYGAEKVVANYNVMGVAKAALEASVRYLAADLGPDGDPGQRDQRRPGPDAGRGGHRRLQEDVRRRSPRSRRCARTSRPRTSARPRSISRRTSSSAVTGEVIYVDGGFNILGVPIGGAD